MEAAELLGVGELDLPPFCRRYEEEGEAGLLDRRIGKASGRRVPVGRCEVVEHLCAAASGRWGFTARHFHEHLVHDQPDRVGTAGRRLSCKKPEFAAESGASRCAPAQACLDVVRCLE